MTAEPHPDDMTVLVGLTMREIDALVTVGDFELTDVPDDFWDDRTRADLARAVEKLRSVAA